MQNEALARILCHNVAYLISAWQELKIDPSAWTPKGGPEKDEGPCDVLRSRRGDRQGDAMPNQRSVYVCPGCKARIPFGTQPIRRLPGVPGAGADSTFPQRCHATGASNSLARPARLISQSPCHGPSSSMKHLYVLSAAG